jgi:hypothetical protein
VQVGVYDPSYYIHDAHIRGNRLYAPAGGMERVDIVDISNKSNPVLLRSLQYQGAYTHSCWTTEDHRFLFVTDEQDGQVARIWNIENLNNVHEVSHYTANLQSLVHNPYIRGRFAFIAHNTEGMRVVDIADPSLPVEVGYYDTFSGPSGGFNGLWSACPYLPSGKILGGDRTGGLYVWTFNNTRAGRLYGTVRDSVTGLPIGSASSSFQESGRTATSDSSGAFRLGDLPGTYTLVISAAGYFTKTVTGFQLGDGDSLSVAFTLRPSVNDVSGSGATPDEFVLHQNFPNPFNPETMIAYDMPVAGRVSLTVYDVAGKDIVHLVDGDRPAGRHAVRLSSDGLASGVYVYRLAVSSSDGRTLRVARKFLLLK